MGAAKRLSSTHAKPAVYNASACLLWASYTGRRQRAGRIAASRSIWALHATCGNSQSCNTRHTNTARRRCPVLRHIAAPAAQQGWQQERGQKTGRTRRSCHSGQVAVLRCLREARSHQQRKNGQVIQYAECAECAALGRGCSRAGTKKYLCAGNK